MIYITGDTHGDISRFKDSKLRKLKKNDYLIVCGDFGFIWDNSKHEQSVLKKLRDMKYTILFVDGCHENFDLLNKYEVSEWNGGKVHFIYDNVIHLMRGQVYEIDGKKIFAMGGGRSQDIDIRREAGTWYEAELQTTDEIMEGFRNLEKSGNKVDYIITHEPPGYIKNCFNDTNLERIEADQFFEKIIKDCSFDAWYFGKCHINKIIPQNFYALFDYIIPTS